MKIRIFLFAVLLVSGFASVSAQSGQRQLRVMTYNLRAGTMATMDQIAEAINKCNPDFVALQEVDCNTYRPNAKATGNNGVNFVNELAQRTGMFGYFGTTIPLPPPAAVCDSLSALVATGNNKNALPAMGHYYGIALLSRYPAKKVETFDLPNPLGAEPRIMLMGNFIIDDTVRVNFASVHLDYTNPGTIALQAEAVSGIAAQSGPAIIAGDFNTEPDSDACRILCRDAAILSGTSPTFPSDNPGRRLDHIFGLPAKDFRLIETREGTSGASPLSDHLPVISLIRFQQRDGD